MEIDEKLITDIRACHERAGHLNAKLKPQGWDTSSLERRYEAAIEHLQKAVAALTD